MPEPLYRYSFSEAKRLSELDDCRASHKANVACRDGIDEMLRERFDGMYLHGDCAAELCREYGIDRVGWVLANTIQHSEWDGRYRPQNKEWAAQTFIPRDKHIDHTVEFCCRSHPEILNGLVSQYRKHLQELGIHDKAACVQSDTPQDFTGKLLILKPEILKDEYKTGDYQYFFAESGFGCDPDSSGRKVFGQFLEDGERTHFNRGDFLGIAEESKLPDWAAKKLQELTQEYISKNYAAVLTDKEKLPQLKAYIDKFLRDKDYHAAGITTKELIDRLYREMAEYSILTPYLGSEELEEININGWDDVALTMLDGSIVKLKEGFHSPQHATDIIKRLLHHSGMIIDNATPMAQGHLPNNTRITALKEPIVDEERGVAVSIRLLHPQRVTLQNLVDTEFATAEMAAFLCMCIRYGVPFVVAGATSSGKTTLLNAIMTSIPDTKRVFTIESGSRELSLVRRKNGRIVNNVVHTLSRPSDNNAYDITQEHLVVASLRFNPDVVCVGEMRDVECYSAVEASLTGHTVVSTVHAGPAAAAHMRIALLCQKRFPINFQTSLMQAGQAFPVVVYAHKLEDNSRKIMDISECVISPAGEREYRCLYNYNITKNSVENGQFDIEGYFGKPNIMSDSLKARLTQYGVPQDELNLFLKGAETV